MTKPHGNRRIYSSAEDRITAQTTDRLVSKSGLGATAHSDVSAATTNSGLTAVNSKKPGRCSNTARAEVSNP